MILTGFFPEPVCIQHEGDRHVKNTAKETAAAPRSM